MSAVDSLPDASTEFVPLPKRQSQLIDDALQIEREEVRSAGALGYMARALAQATLPYTDPKLPAGMLYTRDTGSVKYTFTHLLE